VDTGCRFFDTFQQGVLVEQIIIGIGGKSQFREDRQNGFLPGRFLGQFNCFIIT
jgi:hypothetical protein